MNIDLPTLCRHIAKRRTYAGNDDAVRYNVAKRMLRLLPAIQRYQAQRQEACIAESATVRTIARKPFTAPAGSLVIAFMHNGQVQADVFNRAAGQSSADVLQTAHPGALLYYAGQSLERAMQACDATGEPFSVFGTRHYAAPSRRDAWEVAMEQTARYGAIAQCESADCSDLELAILQGAFIDCTPAPVSLSEETERDASAIESGAAHEYVTLN